MINNQMFNNKNYTSVNDPPLIYENFISENIVNDLVSIFWDNINFHEHIYNSTIRLNNPWRYTKSILYDYMAKFEFLNPERNLGINYYFHHSPYNILQIIIRVNR